MPKELTVFCYFLIPTALPSLSVCGGPRDIAISKHYDGTLLGYSQEERDNDITIDILDDYYALTIMTRLTLLHDWLNLMDYLLL